MSTLYVPELIISTILFTIPYILIFGKLYAKAGKNSSSSAVPVYSSVVMSQIAKKSAVVGVLAGLFLPFAYARMVIDSPIIGLGRLVTAVFYLYLLNAFIKQYNRGIWYWAYALLLPFIAVFSKDVANYKGGITPQNSSAQPQNSGQPSANTQYQNPIQNIQSVVPSTPTPPSTVLATGEQQPPANPLVPSSKN